MARRDIVVVGASAGGVEALSSLVSGLQPDLPAAVFVVMHTPPHGVSLLPQILSRAGPMQAVQAENDMRIDPGRIYVARPDRHLLLANGRVRVVVGPKENRQRPAADPLFRSAARHYGRRAVGVILSGSLDDGTMGLSAIKLGGGVAIVQDPDEALFSGMPRSAADRVDVDYCLPAAEIGPLLVELATTEIEGEKGGNGMSGDGQELGSGEETFERTLGAASVFTCPECHGTLFELSDGDLVNFRCRVGHAYSIDNLFAGQSEYLETALWVALRSLEEKQSMAERMAARAREHGQHRAADRFLEQARETSENSEVIRRVIQRAIERSANPPEGQE